jgi:hypothetical protein
MRTSNNPDLVKPARLAEELGLDPILVKTMVYFRAINGLEQSGAIVRLGTKGNVRIVLLREQFIRWMKSKNLPPYKG